MTIFVINNDFYFRVQRVLCLNWDRKKLIIIVITDVKEKRQLDIMTFPWNISHHHHTNGFALITFACIHLSKNIHVVIVCYYNAFAVCIFVTHTQAAHRIQTCKPHIFHCHANFHAFSCMRTSYRETTFFVVSTHTAQF